MSRFINFIMISVVMFMVMACTCNRCSTDTCTQTDTEQVAPPLEYELTSDVVVMDVTDSTQTYTITQGSIIYIDKDNDENATLYDLLVNRDALNDNEDYGNVIVRMGKINDNTEVVGYMNANALMKHKRLR
jgi:hypothetical protein